MLGKLFLFRNKSFIPFPSGALITYTPSPLLVFFTNKHDEWGRRESDK